MNREIHGWHSPSLNKHMELVKYGHHGFALLLIPTAAADYLEYERFHLIDAIKDFINGGVCKVYSINSINNESWLSSSVPPQGRSIRHNQFNQYVADEVVPFIHNDCKGLVPVVTCGASLGALHAANMFFRRPDVFAGVIAMSGVYDLGTYTKGYWDDTCYFNSPVHYLPNLHDEHQLSQMRNGKKIYFGSGRGNYEDPQASVTIGEILSAKGIPHEIDLWGYEWKHDWPTWRAMLPHVLGTRFS